MNSYTIPQSTKRFSMNGSSIQESMRKKAEAQAKYNNFVNSLMPSLVAESLNYLLQKSLPETVTESDREYGRVLCEQYVQENNASTILRRFETESVMLALIANAINESYTKIIAGTDKDGLVISVKPSDKKDFYRTLENVDTDKACKKITERVCKATEEFIQNNINDKLDMEEAAAKTKEKIEATKASNQDSETAIKQEYASMYRQKTSDIVYGLNRKKNIYEQMVNNAAKTIVKNNELKDSFLTESGKLDVQKITDKVTVMYTFMEMLNTAKIRNVDATYIQECLNSIK